ncbi:hypothetical protein [Nocardioides sp. AE5]|uniref:hypothetical protein n=1 Tax=Nocardioides sp. AE5 TaxID=2962573 RepID=UPI0028829D02|nr:hypothetical protein [Nocardioides sp. AE5]MDT0202168.1 hypothetical protein [Nocardioides sp. AE5]
MSEHPLPGMGPSPTPEQWQPYAAWLETGPDSPLDVVQLDSPRQGRRPFLLGFFALVAVALLANAALGIGIGPGEQVLAAELGLFFAVAVLFVFVMRNRVGSDLAMALVGDDEALRWGLAGRVRTTFSPINEVPWSAIDAAWVVRAPGGVSGLVVEIGDESVARRSGLPTYARHLGPTTYAVGVSARPGTEQALGAMLARRLGPERVLPISDLPEVPPMWGIETSHVTAGSPVHALRTGRAPQAVPAGSVRFQVTVATLVFVASFAWVVFASGSLGYAMPTRPVAEGTAALTECHPTAARINVLCPVGDLELVPVGGSSTEDVDAALAVAQGAGKLKAASTSAEPATREVRLLCRGNEDPIFGNECQLVTTDYPQQPRLLGLFGAPFLLFLLVIFLWPSRLVGLLRKGRKP